MSDQRQRAFEPFGQAAIGGRRLGDAARVVVGEDHRGGAMLQRALTTSRG